MTYKKVIIITLFSFNGICSSEIETPAYRAQQMRHAENQNEKAKQEQMKQEHIKQEKERLKREKENREDIEAQAVEEQAYNELISVANQVRKDLD